MSAFYRSRCINPGDAQAWPSCGSDQCAVVLLHQMLTLPCNSKSRVLANIFPHFGLWCVACVCLGICTTYVEIRVAPCFC